MSFAGFGLFGALRGFAVSGSNKLRGIWACGALRGFAVGGAEPLLGDVPSLRLACGIIFELFVGMGRRLLAAAPPSSSFVKPQGLRPNKFDSLGARASSSLHAIRHVVRRRLPLASLAARLASLAP